MQLGNVVLNSQAFNIWSTILTVILVIFWLALFFATAIGVVNGKLLELDRGWRASYYKSSAEIEKHQQETTQHDGGEDREQ